MSICLDGRHAKDKTLTKRPMSISALPTLTEKLGANKLV